MKKLLPIIIALFFLSSPAIARMNVTMVGGSTPVVTFPLTAVLDNFNDTDDSPMTGWTAASGTFSSAEAQGVAVPGDAGSNTATWNTSYGPNCEAYITITTLPADGENIGLLIRDNGAGGFYAVKYDRVAGADNDTIQIERYDDFLGTQLAIVTQEVSTGDSIGISTVGSTIKSWYKASAGSWVEKSTVMDTTYSSAGSLDIVVSGTTGRLDNFGGGTL